MGGKKNRNRQKRQTIAKQNENPADQRASTSTSTTPTTAMSEDDERSRDKITQIMSCDFVLKKLFSYLPDKTLFDCRLVNKTWSRVASDSLSKRVFVFFDADDYADSDVGMRPFMTTMIRSIYPYITRVYLCDIQLPSTLALQFFHIYGKNISHLRLEYSKSSRSRTRFKNQELYQGDEDMWGVEELRTVLLNNVPKLESLELIGLPKEEPDRNAPIFDQWIRQESTMIQKLQRTAFHMSRTSQDKKYVNVHKMDPSLRGNACNLKSIVLELGGKEIKRWAFIDDLIWMSDRLEKIRVGKGICSTSVIASLLNYGRFIKLKTLIVGHLTYTGLVLLSVAPEYSMRLERFEFQICMMDVTKDPKELVESVQNGEYIVHPLYMETLEGVLASQEKSLKVLKIIPDADNDTQPRIGEMERVTELRMSPDQCRIEFFLNPFRNLKKLSLLTFEVKDEYEWEMYFPQSKILNFHTQIEDLELPYGFQNHLMLNRLRYHFPNIKSLTAKGIDNRNFLVGLWSCWIGLFELHLELKVDFEDETDRIFTGYQEQGMRETFHGYNKIVPIRSITGLFQLQVLEILLDEGICDRTYSFTNAFVLMGLLHMHRLRTVLIPKSKIEKKAIACLLEANPHLTADFEHIQSVNRWWIDD